MGIRSMEKVLVIDDDTALCGMLTEYLIEENLHVESVHDGREGLQKAALGDYDLVVLDVILPGMNGFDVLRELRRESNIPVIMLTARGEQIDRIVGLEIGADDCLSKPFDPRELLARMRAILRRTRLEQPDSTVLTALKVEVGDVTLHCGSRLVFRNGCSVEFTSAEFNLLEILLRRAGQFVSREELTTSVLGRPSYPYDRSIDVHISRLRKKLGHEMGGIERIRTIRNVGYLYALPAAAEATIGGGTVKWPCGAK